MTTTAYCIWDRSMNQDPIVVCTASCRYYKTVDNNYHAKCRPVKDFVRWFGRQMLF